MSLKKLFGMDAISFPKTAGDTEEWVCVCGYKSDSGNECQLCKRKKETVIREGNQPDGQDDGFEQFCLLLISIDKPADAILFIKENLKYFTVAQSEFLLAKLEKDLQMWRFYSTKLTPEKIKAMLDEAMKLS